MAKLRDFVLRLGIFCQRFGIWNGKAQEAIGFLGWMDGALWHGSAIVIVFHWDALVGGLFGGGYTPSYFINVARIESIEDFSSKHSSSPIHSEQ